MSGPDDSSPSSSAAGDLTLTLPEIGSSYGPSERFKLKVAWVTPHLEWRPIKGPEAAEPGGAAPSTPPPQPPPPNVDAALEETERYFKGRLLFDLRRPDWSKVDKAFLSMPTDKPALFPSADQINSWRDDVFFRGLSRTPYLILQPASPPTQAPPLSGPSAPSQFYKLPDPAAQNREPGPPRAGEVGDLLKALWGLPIMERLIGLLNDEAQHQLFQLKQGWKQASTWDRAVAITLGSTLTATAVGTVLGVGEVRRYAFKSLIGVALPIPFVPGASLKLYDFGPLDTTLLGEAGAAAAKAQGKRVEIMLDVPQTVETIGKLVRWIRKK